MRYLQSCVIARGLSPNKLRLACTLHLSRVSMPLRARAD